MMQHDPITIMFKMNGTTCNIQCDYCYEQAERNYNKYANDAKNHIRLNSNDVIQALKKHQNRDYLSIMFHGGEPLLTAKNEFEEIIEYLNNDFAVEHEIQIQTNATLINNSWIELFKKIKVKLVISVSLDPIGTKNLRGISYPNYVNRVWEKIALLQRSGIEVAIISVAHRWNFMAFNDFIEQLFNRKIKFLTINKYESVKSDDINTITEQDYCNLLMSTARFWITNKLYSNIEIQPLMSLFSKHKNKLCQYLANDNKCNSFVTIYPDRTVSCDHLYNKNPIKNEYCNTCNIYTWCGGGCLAQMKDDSFCGARHQLKTFIEGVKNGSI